MLSMLERAEEGNPPQDQRRRMVVTYLMEYAEDRSVSRAYLNPNSIQTLLRNAACGVPT
jgi:negative regulator of genetic competence, sporulation and motility